jgi:hypothetical protein
VALPEIVEIRPAYLRAWVKLAETVAPIALIEAIAAPHFAGAIVDPDPFIAGLTIVVAKRRLAGAVAVFARDSLGHGAPFST